MSFSTTSGTVATRFSPAAVSRGTAINWGIGGGILPWQPSEALPAGLERRLPQERERGCRYRTREQRDVVVQRKSRGNALAIAAGADECGDGRGTDVDDCGGLDAGEDRRRRERQLDQPQALSRLEAERQRRRAHAAADGGGAGGGVARDRPRRLAEKRAQS